jgi:hypothetical protein
LGTKDWSSEEYDHVSHVLQALAGVAWAAPLLRRIVERGGVVPANSTLLFEARVTHAIARRGCEAQYEFSAGEGETSVDFHAAGDPGWLIEVMSLQESDAFLRATTTVTESGALTHVTLLNSNADDLGQSIEGEIIGAQEKIAAKAFNGSVPIKFPTPTSGAYHAIVVDTRGLLRGKADAAMIRQLTHGRHGLRPDSVLYWRHPRHEPHPIVGLFEESNPLPGARSVRERVHFLTLVGKVGFGPGRLTEDRRTYHAANSRLFGCGLAAEEAFSQYPLRPLRRTSGGSGGALPTAAA